MSGFVRICQILSEFVRICQNLRHFVAFCHNLQHLATIWYNCNNCNWSHLRHNSRGHGLLLNPIFLCLCFATILKLINFPFLDYHAWSINAFLLAFLAKIAAFICLASFQQNGWFGLIVSSNLPKRKRKKILDWSILR